MSLTKDSSSSQELTISGMLLVLKRRRSFVMWSTVFFCLGGDPSLPLHDPEIQGDRRDTSCQAKLG